MRVITFFTLSIVFSFRLATQNCDTSLLFKKGAQLEYHTYVPKTKLFSSKQDFFEVTRLIFIVDDVKDSNNVVYSYITKKGVSADEEKDGYEKKYIISCNGEQIFLPADFYITDTTYLSDIYPKVNFRKKKFHTATNNNETVLYSFSINLDKPKVDISSNKLTSEIVTRNYGWERVDEKGRRVFTGGHFERTAQIVEIKYTIESTLAAPQAQSKEKMRVSAGSFDCYKSSMKTKNTFTLVYPANLDRQHPGPDIDGKTIERTSSFYFSPIVGLVKTEELNGGYTELIRVKR